MSICHLKKRKKKENEFPITLHVFSRYITLHVWPTVLLHPQRPIFAVHCCVPSPTAPIIYHHPALCCKSPCSKVTCSSLNDNQAAALKTKSINTQCITGGEILLEGINKAAG